MFVSSIILFIVISPDLPSSKISATLTIIIGVTFYSKAQEDLRNDGARNFMFIDARPIHLSLASKQTFKS